MGGDGTRSGWLADDGRFLDGPAAASTVDWRIADVAAGDLIVLGETGQGLGLQIIKPYTAEVPYAARD